MPEILLHTKLFVPSIRPDLVSRPRLIDQLNQGLDHGRRLILISAPAGFGKTTLAAEWAAGGQRRAAWLSLDQGDSDPARFLTYLVTAVQTILPEAGQAALALLQVPQTPSPPSVLTPLINEIAAQPTGLLLILDDYHLIDSALVDQALSFLIENGPPNLHLAILTRVDPDLPLARLRARGQLTELRAAELRFREGEAAQFLNQTMGLALAAQDIAALEARTEGWIAGLQLAAISMQGSADPASLIKSFTGSNRFVLDYLIAEVLGQQPPDVQQFLLKTAVLQRLSAPLCDALTGRSDGQATLVILDRANLFLVPLDEERRWYRYHHLFADLLRRRLRQSADADPDLDAAVLHRRASQWFEANGLDIEAFQHAAAAGDLDRAQRLVEGEGLPLAFRGALAPVLHWLESLPQQVLQERPSLLVTYAMILQTTGQMAGVEQKLAAAEAVLKQRIMDDQTRDLLGRIADTRGTIGVAQRQGDVILAQAQIALKYLRPDNLTFRTATTWKLGVAHEFRGERAAAAQAYQEAVAISKASGNLYTHILATVGLANIHLAQNRLQQADQTYRDALRQVGDRPIPVNPHVHLCLARIAYQWNDLGAAWQHWRLSDPLALQYKEFSYLYVECELFHARLEMAQGDLSTAAERLAAAWQLVSERDAAYLLPLIAGLQIQALLRLGDLAGAETLAREYELPRGQARVFLAQGNPAAAMAILQPWLDEVQQKDWQDERLKIMILQALAQQALGHEVEALRLLAGALAAAQPGGLLRIFIDEGPHMARLLFRALEGGISTAFVRRLLAAFPDSQPQHGKQPAQAEPEAMIEPLSERELEVLQLIAAGLTNREAADRLYLTLNTIKAHTRNIYGKLGVNSRTQAVNKARALGLL